MADATKFLMLDSTGQAIADAINAKIKTSDYNVHPNLLHNWYFANPVNQRGATSYSNYANGRYIIDRWVKRGASQQITLDNSGMLCTAGSANDFYAVIQAIENGTKRLAGQTVTFSVLISENNATAPYIVIGNAGSAGAVGSAIVTRGIGDQSGLFWVTVVLPETFTNDFLTVGICVWNADSGIYHGIAGDNIRIVAAKLELGETQTLAHQDADGNWILNEVPDYKTELLKCQRYFQVFTSTSARPSYGADCRPAMRTASPTTGTVTINSTTYYTLSSEL